MGVGVGVLRSVLREKFDRIGRSGIFAAAAVVQLSHAHLWESDQFLIETLGLLVSCQRSITLCEVKARQARQVGVLNSDQSE